MTAPFPTSSHRPFTRILGIDSGAKRCGISFIDRYNAADLRLQHASAVGQERDMRTTTYGEYRRHLVEHWTEAFGALFDAWQPDIVICETVPITGAANASGQRIQALMAVVVAHALCCQRDIDFQEIAANSVKLRVTGNGGATKPKVREAVIGVFPELAERRKEMIHTADISDAVAVGLCGAGYDCN